MYVMAVEIAWQDMLVSETHYSTDCLWKYFENHVRKAMELKMKKITALLTVLMMCMTFGANFVYAADGNSARNAVLQIRKEIDSHKSNIQSKNGELFKLTPEEIAEADFKNYDTSSVLLGTDLYEFSAGSVSNDIKGKDGTINTLAPNEQYD